MLKYSEFDLVSQILFEGRLHCSDRFTKKLSFIQDDKIANLLLSMSSTESPDELRSNYIDISDGKEDTVTFLPSNKKSNSPFLDKGRSEIKIGRLANTLLRSKNSAISDKEIETFVNRYKSLHSVKDESFKIVKGEDIKKWYNHKRYYNGKGSLGNSCMRKSSSNTFDLYAKNKNVSLLILRKKKWITLPWVSGSLTGRAILWKLNTGEILMDRVYTNKDSDAVKFYNLARSSGWLFSFHGDIFRDGQRMNYDKWSDLEKGEFKKYPYLDTLRYMNIEKTKLFSSEASVVTDSFDGGGDGRYYLVADFTTGELSLR